jgi:antitoxin PrlF
MISTITSKGQITIPKAIRESMNLNPKDKVDFILDGDRVILHPVKPIQDFRGCIETKGASSLAEERKKFREAIKAKASKEDATK